MSVSRLINRAESIGVHLSLNGDSVKMRGPARAIQTLKPELAPHKPEIVAHLRAAANDAGDCTGALVAPGGAHLPWGPHLSVDDVQRMLAELVGLIEEIARAEGWPREHLDDVLSRATRGPLADLMPNLQHFRGRAETLRIEQAARAAVNARTWHGEGFDDRRLT